MPGGALDLSALPIRVTDWVSFWHDSHRLPALPQPGEGHPLRHQPLGHRALSVQSLKTFTLAPKSRALTPAKEAAILGALAERISQRGYYAFVCQATDWRCC
jgi:hypothetical protein